LAQVHWLGVGPPLPPGACLASAAPDWVESPTPDRSGCWNGRGCSYPSGSPPFAYAQKNQAARVKEIIFIDESRLSKRSHCCWNWTTPGQASGLQYYFNRNILSPMAVVLWCISTSGCFQVPFAIPLWWNSCPICYGKFCGSYF